MSLLKTEFLRGKTPFAAIAEKDEGHKTKPAKYKHIPDNEFADPVNFKYPIDREHVVAAWSYINKPENQKKGGYSDAEWALMKKRVKAAMKKYGHEVADADGKNEKKSMLVYENFRAYQEMYLKIRGERSLVVL